MRRLYMQFLASIEDKGALVTPENCKKCLEILFLICCTFASDQIKEESNKFFGATFGGATFEQLLSNFLRNGGQLFGKTRATCGKP